MNWETRINLLSLVMQAGYPPVILWGPPGVGKTSVVKQLANLLGMEVIIVIASSKDPADVLGIDWVSDGMTQKFPPRWATLANRFAEEGKRSVVFLDEITTAPQMVQNVLLSVVQDRLVGETKIDERAYIIAAGNYSSVTGESLSQALANRFLHLTWDYDRKGFISYLNGEDNVEKYILEVNPNRDMKYKTLKEYLALYIEFVKDIGLCEPQEEEFKSKPYPSPRSLDIMLKALSLVPDDGDYTELENLIARSAVGPEGVGFLTWLRRRKEIPPVEELLFNNVELPKGRTDLAVMIIKILYNFLLKNNSDEVWDAVFKFVDKFVDSYIELTVILADALKKAYQETRGASGAFDIRFIKSKLGVVMSKIGYFARGV
ncbi:MAG: MoxR family ATPase [candidate division WOR-3 bacterium]